jgi:hypothetical protein
MGNEFSEVERARFPEAVARPHSDHVASSAAIARGIEALESVDSDGSLVASYQCKCGVEIREYESRIVGTCTCSSNRAPPGKSAAKGLVRAAGSVADLVKV